MVMITEVYEIDQKRPWRDNPKKTWLFSSHGRTVSLGELIREGVAMRQGAQQYRIDTIGL